MLVLDVADVYLCRRERVGRGLVVGPRDAVDERGLADVGVARDDDGRVLRADIRKRPELLAGLEQRLEVRVDLLDDVRETCKRLLAVFAGGLGVGVSQPRGVLVADIGRLPGRPADFVEMPAELVDADAGVGQVAIERVQPVEIRPRGDDVLEVVGDDVARSL